MYDNLYEILLSFPEDFAEADDKDYCIRAYIEKIYNSIDEYRDILSETDDECEAELWID